MEKKEEFTQDALTKGFATAFTTVMSRALPETNGSTIPILRENKHVFEELDRERRARRAARRKAAIRKKAREQGHVAHIDDACVDKERALKRVATKGVVQLFNSLRAARQRIALSGDGNAS